MKFKNVTFEVVVIIYMAQNEGILALNAVTNLHVP
jgi:hypothetical protein